MCMMDPLVTFGRISGLTVCQKMQFPELFSFTKTPNILLRYALSVEGPDQIFHLPLSNIALQQLTILAQDLDSLQETNGADVWSYIWGSNYFSSSKAYKQLTGHRDIHRSFKWMWKSACQNKHKVFFWLLLNDWLSTRARLRRRNMELPSYVCVCCSLSVEETLPHLFMHCSFAQSCWASIGLTIGMNGPFSSLENLRLQLGVPFFMEVIILMNWCIWM